MLTTANIVAVLQLHQTPPLIHHLHAQTPRPGGFGGQTKWVQYWNSLKFGSSQPLFDRIVAFARPVTQVHTLHIPAGERYTPDANPNPFCSSHEIQSVCAVAESTQQTGGKAKRTGSLITNLALLPGEI